MTMEQLEIVVHYAGLEQPPAYVHKCKSDTPVGRLMLEIEVKIHIEEYPPSQKRVLPSCVGMTPQQILSQDMTAGELLSRRGCLIIFQGPPSRPNIPTMSERLTGMYYGAQTLVKEELASSQDSHVSR